MAEGYSCHPILLMGRGDKRKQIAVGGYHSIGIAPHSPATKFFAVASCLLFNKKNLRKVHNFSSSLLDKVEYSTLEHLGNEKWTFHVG